MSKEALIVELMEELIPKDQHVCPKCKKQRLTCDDNFQVWCPSCHIYLRPSRNEKRSSSYFDTLAKALVAQIKSSGFYQQPWLEKGAGLLKINIEKNTRYGTTFRHYALFTLAELILSRLASIKAQEPLALDYLEQARGNIQKALELWPGLSWKASVLIEDLIAMELEIDQDPEGESPLIYYQNGLNKAQNLSKKSKTSENKRKSLLALQYLLLGLHFQERALMVMSLARMQGADNLEQFELELTEQEQQVIDKLIETLNPSKQMELNQAMAKACFDQVLALQPDLIHGHITSLTEGLLIEYMIGLAEFYQHCNERQLAEKLLQASTKAAVKQWAIRQDLASLNTLTTNRLFFFEQVLMAESSDQKEALEQAKEILAQWRHDWTYGQARVFLANDFIAWLSFERQMEQVIQALEVRELFGSFIQFFRETIDKLEGLARKENGPLIDNMIASLYVRLAFATAKKKHNVLEAKKAKSIYTYARKALNLWKKLLKISPSLLLQERKSMELLRQSLEMIDEKVRDKALSGSLKAEISRIRERLLEMEQEEEERSYIDQQLDRLLEGDEVVDIDWLFEEL